MKKTPVKLDYSTLDELPKNSSRRKLEERGFKFKDKKPTRFKSIKPYTP